MGSLAVLPLGIAACVVALLGGLATRRFIETGWPLRKVRRPDYARIAALERELGIGVIEEIEEPEPAPRLPSFRAPIQPGVPFEQNGAWFIRKGPWQIGYGPGEEGHRRALDAAQHPQS